MIIKTRYDKNGYGNYIDIQSHNINNGERVYPDVAHRYAHMNKESHLMKGDLVETGEYVGEIGATGAVTGPHLHFETRIEANTKPIAPKDTFFYADKEINRNRLMPIAMMTKMVCACPYKPLGKYRFFWQ